MDGTQVTAVLEAGKAGTLTTRVTEELHDVDAGGDRIASYSTAAWFAVLPSRSEGGT